MTRRTVIAEKLTRNELRKMQPGDTTVFHLPSAVKVDSARAHTYGVSHQMGCRFTTHADYTDNSLEVTRL